MHTGLQMVCITLLGGQIHLFLAKNSFLAIWCPFDTSSLTYLMSQVPSKVTYGGPQHGHSLLGDIWGVIW